jgi:hypothetical protein
METYNFELHEKRKCKCVKHVGSEKWHNSFGGWTYHLCRCSRCDKSYHGYRSIVTNSYIPVSPTQRICKNAECSNVFTSKGTRIYCSSDCSVSTNNKLIYRRRQLWISQNGICAMCHTELPFDEACLDHDHSCCDVKARSACGNCDRGVIHNHCNAILGFARDDTKLLRQAIEYLGE